jgi:hypothetical protein
MTKKVGDFRSSPGLHATCSPTLLAGHQHSYDPIPADEGVVELTDYMPINQHVEEPNEIVRTVSVIRGNVTLTMRCQPRFNYARTMHRTEIPDRCAIFFPFDNSFAPIALYSITTLERVSQDVHSNFKLQAGDTATFVFGAQRSHG